MNLLELLGVEIHPNGCIFWRAEGSSATRLDCSKRLDIRRNQQSNSVFFVIMINGYTVDLVEADSTEIC